MNKTDLDDIAALLNRVHAHLNESCSPTTPPKPYYDVWIKDHEKAVKALCRLRLAKGVQSDDKKPAS